MLTARHRSADLVADGLHHRIRRAHLHQPCLPLLPTIHLPRLRPAVHLTTVVYGDGGAALSQARVRDALRPQVLPGHHARPQYLQELGALLDP